MASTSRGVTRKLKLGVSQQEEGRWKEEEGGTPGGRGTTYVYVSAHLYPSCPKLETFKWTLSPVERLTCLYSGISSINICFKWRNIPPTPGPWGLSCSGCGQPKNFKRPEFRKWISANEAVGCHPSAISFLHSLQPLKTWLGSSLPTMS